MSKEVFTATAAPVCKKLELSLRQGGDRTYLQAKGLDDKLWDILYIERGIIYVCSNVSKSSGFVIDEYSTVQSVVVQEEEEE